MYITFMVLHAQTKEKHESFFVDMCPGGMERHDMTSSCQVCSMGMYRVEGSMSQSCLECPGGLATTMEGATSEEACVELPFEIGTFNPSKCFTIHSQTLSFWILSSLLITDLK